MKTIHANQVTIAISDSPHPVLVDFFSKSCPPCTALTPVLEELAADFDGRIDFVKADAMADDESLKLSASLGIRAVPTLILFKNGTEAARRTGAASKAALASWLLENL
jgi:thioredoxin 1